MIKRSLKRKRVENWLLNKKPILNVVQFERGLGFTRGIISKFYSNKRILSQREIQILDQYVQDSIDQYLDIE